LGWITGFWDDEVNLILFQHHFGGFDYRRNFIADLQFHFFGAPLRDHAFDYVRAHTDTTCAITPPISSSIISPASRFRADSVMPAA
jgi:hypothetical protein